MNNKYKIPMTNDRRPLTLLSPRPVLLLIIILLAFFLRVWRLPQTPPGFWYDEAYYSMDAAWLVDGGPWRLFFVGNNGREPMFIYLQALFIWMFGASPLTSRLIAPLVGTLTVPLVFVLAKRLSRGANWPAGWIPIVAAAGMAISFWHVGLSRSGYRGILLPLATALVFYLFWRSWQEKSWRLAVLAGLVLGLSQYTYLAARALPLVFAGYGLLGTLRFWFNRPRPLADGWPSLPGLWRVLLIMAGLSALVFAPLGWIFYNDPALFSARTGDVLFSPHNPTELLTHIWSAVRLFIDSGDPNWRHHLPGRPMLGWLGWLGFWPGLLLCLWRWRKPAYLFLVTALAVLYLPALLSVPPVHALRLSALLPIYYVIFALGLAQLVGWGVSGRLKNPVRGRQIGAAIVVGILLVELGLTVFDYFDRWAGREETYVEYNAPLVDFVEHVADVTRDMPVIIPFQIYVHPTTRYLLHDQFTERPAPANLSGPVQLVTLPDNFRLLNVANIPELPAYAWLARDEAGRGVVYVSRPPRTKERAYLKQPVLVTPPQVYRDRFERDLAYFRTVEDAGPLIPMFTQTAPQRTINLNWDNQAQLLGYDVLPEVVSPNQPITINFYWRSLTNKTFDSRLFLQLVDSAGNPITQWEGEAFREDMYRWRPNGILPSQHTLWVGPDTPAGPYFVRMGFFDQDTGERLPLRPSPSLPVADGVDQVQVGLFYVSPSGFDPRTPAIPLEATFGDAIRLIGVTLPDIQNAQLTTQNSQLKTVFHWQAIRPTKKPYTVFLQLLDENNQVVSSWDSQPFNGLYPTNFWSPGERVTDTFTLPLPAEGLPPGPYRLITGFYDFETFDRLPLVGGDDFTELARFVVK